MRKLLVIAPSYWPVIGGVEKHLSKVLPIISDHGYKIVVLVRYSKNLPRYQRINNIDVYRLPKEGPRYIVLVAWLMLHRSLWNEVNVVHSHDYFIPFLRKHMRTRWVHTYHGFGSYPVREEAKKSRQYVKRIVDYSFAVGKFIEKWYGTPCDEIIWGASDMRLQTSNKTKKDYTYLFLGRLESDTGVIQYLRAFRDIAKRDRDSTLLIVGGGSLHSNLTKYIHDHQLEARVTIQEATAHPETVLRKGRVALVSGYLAIIEAGRNYLPVVAFYDNPLKKDYLKLHPVADALYIAGSQNELVRMMQAAVKDDNHFARMLNTWSKKQTWEELSRKYIESYEDKI